MVGGADALQAPINSHLGKSVGTFQAAFLSFAIGTVALLAIAALASGGLGGVTAATIAGQLTLAVVIDRLGWLGVEQKPITVARILGVLLLAAGVTLIVRD